MNLKTKKITPIFLIFHVLFQAIFGKFLYRNDEKEISLMPSDGGFKSFHGNVSRAEFGSPEFWQAIMVAIACVIGAGICSGLTVGYLSIEELDLKMILKGDDEKKKSQARKILPVIQKHHLLLSTLLVANAIAMETLPICLAKIFPAFVAILFSTIVVVIVGEILPQAICTGPKQLDIACFFVPLMYVMMAVFFVICYPIAKLLDCILGNHHDLLFHTNDLKALINIHSKDQVFSSDQFKLMQSLFDLRGDSVEKQMVKYDKVFSLDEKEIITPELIKRVQSYGYSQFPVYKRNRQNVWYIMKTKHFLHSSESLMGKTLKNRFTTKKKEQETLKIKKSSTMLDILMLFNKKKQTFALVVDEVEIKSKQKQNNDFLSGVQSMCKNEDEQQTIIGIITLKDVFEEIMDQQLVDEDLHKGQTIQIEELKTEKMKLKEQNKIIKQQFYENDAEEEKQQKEEEYFENEIKQKQLKKQIKSQMKKSKKQEQLIANFNAKKLKTAQGGLNKNGNELQNVGNWDDDNDLSERFIERKQSV